jgi:hypothetical protein
MMSEDSGVDIFGTHVVLGLGDVYQHDGQQADSILTKRWRKTLFSDIDNTYYRRSFVVHNQEFSEVWFCYVEAGTTNADTNLIQPNKLLAWNYKQNTFSVRDLPNVPFMTTGIPSGIVAATFDADAGTFDSAGDTFDDVTFTPQREKLIACLPHASAPRLLQMDYGDLELGAAMSCTVERKALPIMRQGRDGSMRIDLQSNKFVRRIYPRVSGTAGGQIDFYIGVSNVLSESPTYHGPYTFTIGTTKFMTVLKRGRIISLKALSNTNITWKLSGFDLDLRMEGER